MAWALGRLGNPAMLFLYLVLAIEDVDPWIRYEVIEALGRLNAIEHHRS